MFSILKQFFLPSEARAYSEIFSGLTVALALVPEAIAFSLVAHVDPLIGLFSAFFMCLASSILGGRPGMISGATGAMAIVVVSLVTQFGLNYLFATMVLTGIIQCLVGGLKLGKLIRILPKPVMVGFVNGLACVIFISQLQQFKIMQAGQLVWLGQGPLMIMLALVAVAMLITHYLPRLNKTMPAALVAILAVSALVYALHIDTRVVADMMSSPITTATFPNFTWLQVPMTLATLKIILPYAIVLSIVGLSESLMTLTLIDEITNTRGNANRECIAQGIGNIASGFFKGMGGCVMLGQSMININSGARGRLSSFIASLALLAFVLLLWPIIKLIPLAALVGVMFMVVIETFEWMTFRFIRKIPRHDAFVIVLVTLVTIWTNLAIAVITGVIISALTYAWESAKNIRAEKYINSDGAKEYKVYGPLFFASTSQFKSLFDFNDEQEEVIIDFMHSRVADHSAITAIQAITEKYSRLKKQVHLRHLSQDCKRLLGKAGDLVRANVLEDPDYQVASDSL